MSSFPRGGVTAAPVSFWRAAYRHIVFDFDRIADYYAKASKKVQELMEHSALVIIDYNDAIANGYAILSEALEDMMEQDNA